MIEMATTRKKITAAAAALTVALAGIAPISAAAEQVVVTEYDELWTRNIEVKAGESVKWYVNVPEGTEPKGCKATIKIPGLGWGTDTHNKEEGHLKLEQGENFVYEFTPEEEGDILYTCWMGSGCHKGYIHVLAAEQPVEVEVPEEVTVEETEEAQEETTSPTEETTEAGEPTEQEAAADNTEEKIEPQEDIEAEEDEEATDNGEDEKPTLSQTKNTSETAATPAQTQENTENSNPKAGSGAGGLFTAALAAGAMVILAGRKKKSR